MSVRRFPFDLKIENTIKNQKKSKKENAKKKVGERRMKESHVNTPV